MTWMVELAVGGSEGLLGGYMSGMVELEISGSKGLLVTKCNTDTSETIKIRALSLTI